MKRSATPFLVFAGISAAVAGFFLLLPTPEARSARTGLEGADGSFSITNVRVFDGERFRDRATVSVRDGRITAVAASGSGAVAEGEGRTAVSGEGRTLLPGFIDAHTHVFAGALKEALAFGVTTELDMFTMPPVLAAAKARRAGTAARDEADLYSSGILATAPGGHGTEFGFAIPTLTRADEAAAFVDARIAEGSDYLKIVLDDGATYGLRFPTLDAATVAALVEAAHRRGKLVVVHVSGQAAARRALEAGADGLAHAFSDAPADPGLVALARARGAFVVPTLTVLESFAGAAGGQPVLGDARLARFLVPAQRGTLERRFTHGADAKADAANARETVRRLHAAGVTILAGTDAPNPGTAHGASLHRELELLAGAGLTPLEALAAATSAPAARFGLEDRGRIAPGRKADLVLVDGDPAADITATRAIVAVWKNGHPVARGPAASVAAAAPRAPEDGRISDFDGGDTASRFGQGWHAASDQRMGGSSRAAIEAVKEGARGTAGALSVRGEVKAGSPFPWAGAVFFPGDAPMRPVDLGGKKELVFQARGDEGRFKVMLLGPGAGGAPAEQGFAVGPGWREVRLPLGAFAGADLSAVGGLMFSAGPAPGAFHFDIDEVELR